MAGDGLKLPRAGTLGRVNRGDMMLLPRFVASMVPPSFYSSTKVRFNFLSLLGELCPKGAGNN